MPLSNYGHGKKEGARSGAREAVKTIATVTRLVRSAAKTASHHLAAEFLEVGSPSVGEHCLARDSAHSHISNRLPIMDSFVDRLFRNHEYTDIR